MPRTRTLRPIHPGELLRDELAEINRTPAELARALAVPINTVNEILNGKRNITLDTAACLAQHFGTSPQYWLNLQNAYDRETANQAAIESPRSS